MATTYYTVGETPEAALVERISRLFGPPPKGVVSIGDDAAVLPPSSRSLVISNDTLVEGTHYKSDWLSPRELGRRAMAVAASDLAAMGAEPEGAVAALTLAKGMPLRELDGLLRGMAAAGRAWRLPVLGGNLARGRETGITLTVWGRIRGKAWLRRGARPGDTVFVTGVPGWAHLGLKLLGRRGRTPVKVPGARRALAAWVKPVPRFDAVPALRRAAPRGVLDTSDSLAQTLEHLLGKTLDIELAPPEFPKSYVALAEHLRVSPHRAWHFGGEDYELCFALSPARARRVAEDGALGGIPVTAVGTLRRGSGLLRTAGGGLLSGAAFRHFG